MMGWKTPYCIIECVITVQGHPRSLILVLFKSGCDFLLVINSNLGSILLRFRDITGFLLKQPAHASSMRNFALLLLASVQNQGHLCTTKRQRTLYCGL